MRLFLTTVFLFLATTHARPQAPLPKQPAEKLDGPPVVTAKVWAIADGKTGQFLWGSQENEPVPIASTTKIMTAHLVLNLAAKDPKVLDETLVVSERAAKMTGSSARIETGDRYKVGELLYGLLLPSGNDASIALAEHFGTRFLPDAKDGKKPTAAESFEAFVAEMNRRAKELKMTQTKYYDPHGLSKNQASARDLSVLAWTALQDKPFREYVNTRQHTYEVLDVNGAKRTVIWTNTNRLLGIEGYEGVKTGTTTPAGSCLVAAGTHDKDRLIVVVLGCPTNDSRYADARNLFRWAWRERAAKNTP